MTSRRRVVGRPWVVTALLLALLSPSAAQDGKLDAQALVTRHLQSIGPDQTRAARKTSVAQGVGQLRILTGGTGTLEGPAYFFSDGRKLRFVIQFSQPTYPAEEFAFDGSKPVVAVIQPRVRSRLGQFLYLYNDIIKEGLLGSTLSTAWPLTDLAERGAKLQYIGLKKIDGRELHEARYQLKKGGDLSIHLYFEPETFRHLRTTYRLRITAQIGAGPAQSSGQRDSIFTLEERFDGFKTVDGLTLPTHWTLRLSTEGTQGSSVNEWDISFDKIVLNQEIDPKFFAVQ